MKASKEFIAMLTQGQIDYEKIGSFFRVSSVTARRICDGEVLSHETAVKIARAFPDVSPRILFRNPVRPFELRERLEQQERLKANGELSAEAKARIVQMVWQRTRKNKSQPQSRTQCWQRKKLRIQSGQTGTFCQADNQITNPVSVAALATELRVDKSSLLKTLKQGKISLQKMPHLTGGGIQMISVIGKEDADRMYRQIMAIKYSSLEWQPPVVTVAEVNGVTTEPSALPASEK